MKAILISEKKLDELFQHLLLQIKADIMDSTTREDYSEVGKYQRKVQFHLCQFVESVRSAE